MRIPAQSALGFGRVSQQLVHLGGAEVLRIHLDKHFSGRLVDAFLIDALALPLQFDAGVMEGQSAELPYRVALARGDDVVVGLVLLQDEPHALHIVARVTPVTQGIEVTQVEFVLQAVGDACGGNGNLACDEGLAAALALMIEQDAVGAEHAVTLAVVLHDPERVQFCATVGAAGIERCGLALGHLLHLAVEFAGTCLIDARHVLAAGDAHGLDKAQRAHSVGLGRVFRHVKRHLHVALCRQVVNLVGLGLLDDADERTAVGHVAVVQVDEALLFHVAHPLVKVQVLDAARVETAAAADDAVHLIAFLQQEFCQIGAVLSRDARDEGDFLLALVHCVIKRYPER